MRRTLGNSSNRDVSAKAGKPNTERHEREREWHRVLGTPLDSVPVGFSCDTV